MINLFGGGKPEHPMANPREAKRLLEALPPQELKALEELAGWLESVSLAEGFKPAERVGLVTAIDDAAQPRLRKVARDYFAAQRPSKYQESLMWKQMHEYWRHAGLAWGRVIDALAGDAKALPMPLVRALRSLGQQIKWQHLRYGPVDPAVWGVINRIYALAEARGLADAKFIPAAGLPETTPKLEFLRAAMFDASSPDGLLPAEIELAERFVAELAPRFAVGAKPAKELVYWIDLGRAMAPSRVIKPPTPAAGLRLFGPGSALDTLEAYILKVASTRQLPSTPNLGGTYEPEAVLEVANHLALYWAPELPERKHPRHNVKSRLSIAHGFDGVVDALGGGSSLDLTGSPATESWVVENVSAGGLGAVVPQVKGDWLRVGALLAMQPDGGANWVAGVVRRLNRTSGQEARVGIETLSRAPAIARFQMRDVGEQVGILLPSPVLGSGETAIALRTGIYARGQNLETRVDGKHHVYMPQGAGERGEDYDLVRFRQMVRED